LKRSWLLRRKLSRVCPQWPQVWLWI